MPEDIVLLFEVYYFIIIIVEVHQNFDC